MRLCTFTDEATVVVEVAEELEAEEGKDKQSMIAEDMGQLHILQEIHQVAVVVGSMDYSPVAWVYILDSFGIHIPEE